jgi:hypothetical protein
MKKSKEDRVNEFGQAAGEVFLIFETLNNY